MHELALAESMARELEETLSAEGGSKIISITVVIGELSGINREAFEFAFPSLAGQYPILERTILNIEEVPTETFCRNCNSKSAVRMPFIACEKCGSLDVEITGGKELIIKSLEIE